MAAVGVVDVESASDGDRGVFSGVNERRKEGEES